MTYTIEDLEFARSFNDQEYKVARGDSAFVAPALAGWTKEDIAAHAETLCENKNVFAANTSARDMLVDMIQGNFTKYIYAQSFHVLNIKKDQPQHYKALVYCDGNKESVTDFFERQDMTLRLNGHVFSKIDQFGGEGMGDDYWHILEDIQPNKEITYWKLAGYYASYDGARLDIVTEVEPKKVLNIEWKSKQ